MYISIFWNNTELRHLKGPKKDQTLSENNWYVASLQKNQTDVSHPGGKHLYILLPGPSLAVRPFEEQLCHNFCTKKKIVGNIKMIDLNCNWLPVCAIYVNDCIYKCMNAFNLQVSPHASAILQGGIVFFWSFDQSTEIW